MSMHYGVAAFAPMELKSGETGDPAEIVEKALGDLRGSLDERLADIEKKSTARLDKIEAAIRRPAVHGSRDDETGAIEKKAFSDYIAGRALGAEEQKTLTLAAPGTGGVLVPPEVRTSIITKLTEFSPIRAVATSYQMSGALLQMPRLVNEVTVGEVTETATRPESEPTFDMIDVKPFEQAVIVPVSRIMLEDNAVGLEGFITGHIATRFGVKESGWFVNGNGTTQAEGVMTSADVTSRTTAGAAITADDLIDTFYDVKSAYSARGTWLMNRATMAVVRKLKDSTGQYLWQPSAQAGQPASLLGRPVLEAVDMPNPTSGLYPIVFGDFASGYMIADRVDFQLARDEVTAWNSGIVKFNARRRVGGRVILGEALRKLRVKV